MNEQGHVAFPNEHVHIAVVLTSEYQQCNKETMEANNSYDNIQWKDGETGDLHDIWDSIKADWEEHPESE